MRLDAKPRTFRHGLGSLCVLSDLAPWLASMPGKITLGSGRGHLALHGIESQNSEYRGMVAKRIYFVIN